MWLRCSSSRRRTRGGRRRREPSRPWSRRIRNPRRGRNPTRGVKRPRRGRNPTRGIRRPRRRRTPMPRSMWKSTRSYWPPYCTSTSRSRRPRGRQRRRPHGKRRRPPRETPPPAAAQEAARPAARGATPLAGPAPEAPMRARSASSQVRAPRKMRLGEDLSARTGTARLLPHVWRAGSGLAVLLLLAQIVNHYRDELAATARFHRPITALYASLGIPLAPRWDLRAYEVRQLGASVEPASAGLIT